jgi:hypothetical protein
MGQVERDSCCTVGGGVGQGSGVQHVLQVDNGNQAHLRCVAPPLVVHFR